jgi:ribosomal protein L40E
MEMENTAFTRYLSTELANTRIRSALLDDDRTKDAQVAGVGTTKTGYVIRFTNEKSAEIARESMGWRNNLGNGTKLVKPRYGVVIHRTPTEAIALPDGKDEGIKTIMEENNLASKGFQIEDIAWLSKKDKPIGRSASLGVWFDTQEAATWTIDNGLVFGQKYVGSVEAYQFKKKICHNCARPGHLAWNCKNSSRCSHCAGDHERRECPPGSPAKCLDCGGKHPTGHRECRGQLPTPNPQ